MITPRRYPYILTLSAGLCASLVGAANAAIPFAAATSGNIAEIQTALDAGGKIDELDSKGETLLILACRAGQLETVQFLLAHGADINRANEGGYTPVHVAVSAQKIDVVRYLIDQGADLEIPQKGNEYPMHAAAAGVSLQMLQMLIDAGADLDVQDGNQETPLNYAVYQGRLGNVKKLLAAGASLRLSNTRNPVIRASGRNQPEILAYLLNYLKNPPPVVTSMPAGRRDPLNAAIISGDLPRVKELIQDAKYQSYPRMMAAISMADRHGRYDISRVLSKANAQQAELQARRQVLNEKLMDAIRDDKYKEADGLLYAGADPNYVDKDGRMTLARAVKSPPMVKLFLKYHADPLFTSPAMKVRMPLYEAASENARESVEAMLASTQISPDQLNKTLYFATYRTKSAPLVRELLNRGADPNVANADGNTALHSAAADSDAEVVKILLAAGANAGARNRSGKTPADFAAAGANTDILTVLKGAGAVVPVVKKHNPLFIAVASGTLAQVKKLAAEGHSLNDLETVQFGDGKGDRSLLWYALNFCNDAEIARYLIEQKTQGEPWLLGELVARPNAFGPHQAGLLQLMIDNGYDVNLANPAGQTPLMLAAMMDNYRDASILLKKGAKVDVRDNDNRSALDYARQGSNSSMVKLLEQAGAK